MENPFAMPTASTSADWLIFAAMLLAMCLPVAAFVVWLLVRKKSAKHRRKQRKRHHRQLNPTLAQTGGLPPIRPPGEPPHGV